MSFVFFSSRNAVDFACVQGSGLCLGTWFTDVL